MSGSEGQQAPKVSVIIPVWNPGDGIDRCLDSLRKQTLEDIEMIFVDDRGTDDAMEKVRAAAAEDPRIRILVNPRNLGAGPSRNAGIEAARGEYLAFVDPDDHAAPNFLEILYNTAVAEDADIAKGSCVFLNDDGSRVERAFSLNKRIRKGLSEYRPLFEVLTAEHWSCLYKRTLFDNGEVRYGTTRRDQDTTFLLKAAAFAKHITICDEAVYYYQRRSGSAFNTITHEALPDLTAAFDEKMCFVLAHLPGDEHSRAYVLYKTNIRLKTFYFLVKGFDYSKEETEHLDSLIRSLRRFPWVDELARESLPVRILLEHRVCLPNHVFKLPWDRIDAGAYVRLAFDWLRFILSHPRYMPDLVRQVPGLIKTVVPYIWNK